MEEESGVYIFDEGDKNREETLSFDDKPREE